MEQLAESDELQPWSRVERELGELRDLFHRRLLNDRVHRQLADELHLQLERADADRVGRLLEPVLRQLILVIDRIESALVAVPMGEPSELVESVRQELLEVLARNHVARVPAMGELFDARLHQAVGTLVTDPADQGRVVREVRAGYVHGERVLRPAEVEVGGIAEADQSGGVPS